MCSSTYEQETGVGSCSCVATRLGQMEAGVDSARTSQQGKTVACLRQQAKTPARGYNGTAKASKERNGKDITKEDESEGKMGCNRH